MKLVFFTGATGLLGKYFLADIPPGFKVVGSYKSNIKAKRKYFIRLDIASKRKTELVIKDLRPDVVVHAASIGSVDYCETHKREANDVNVKGTENIIAACSLTGSKLIFISSNAVYDGKNSPYSEDSPRNPLDEYGRTKVRAEELVASSGLDFNIVRLMTMYGWPPKSGRSNPVDWVISELLEGKEIKVVDDIFNNHLYAGSAAKSLWQLIQKDYAGETFNIAGKDCISRYELAKKVADRFELNSELIKPVKNSFFKNIAPRPRDTCFNTDKMEKKLHVDALSVDYGLKEMLHEK